MRTTRCLQFSCVVLISTAAASAPPEPLVLGWLNAAPTSVLPTHFHAIWEVSLEGFDGYARRYDFVRFPDGSWRADRAPYKKRHGDPTTSDPDPALIFVFPAVTTIMSADGSAVSRPDSVLVSVLPREGSSLAMGNDSARPAKFEPLDSDRYERSFSKLEDFLIPGNIYFARGIRLQALLEQLPDDRVVSHVESEDRRTTDVVWTSSDNAEWSLAMTFVQTSNGVVPTQLTEANSATFTSVETVWDYDAESGRLVGVREKTVARGSGGRAFSTLRVFRIPEDELLFGEPPEVPLTQTMRELFDEGPFAFKNQRGRGNR